MRTISNADLQNVYRDWLKRRAPSRAAAVTLTFYPTESGRPIPECAARRTIRMFCRLLNSLAYGNSFSKAKKRHLAIISVTEGGWEPGEKNPHFHLLIEAPANYLVTDWVHAIRRTIEKMTSLSTNQSKVEAVRDDGWIDYMLKLRDKKNFSDAIDLSNLWLNP